MSNNPRTSYARHPMTSGELLIIAAMMLVAIANVLANAAGLLPAYIVYTIFAALFAVLVLLFLKSGRGAIKNE